MFINSQSFLIIFYFEEGKLKAESKLLVVEKKRESIDSNK